MSITRIRSTSKSSHIRKLRDIHHRRRRCHHGHHRHMRSFMFFGIAALPRHHEEATAETRKTTTTTMMPTLKTTGILACSLGTLCGMPRRVDAFCMQRHRLQSNALRCAKYSDEFLQRVEEKLVWEKLEESTQKPVLDLSKHRGFLASDNSDSNDDYDDDYDDIPTIVWDQTKSELEHLGIHMKDEAVQQECPQLYRLDTAMVLDTAQYLLSQNYSATSITPKLLSFHASDVEYGLEFLKTMMMNPNVSMSTLPAALLLSGIEGGIQERAVQSALSSASDATSQANQRIVGDIQSTIRQRKKFLGKKMP